MKAPSWAFWRFQGGWRFGDPACEETESEAPGPRGTEAFLSLLVLPSGSHCSIWARGRARALFRDHEQICCTIWGFDPIVFLNQIWASEDRAPYSVQYWTKSMDSDFMGLKILILKGYLSYILWVQFYDAAHGQGWKPWTVLIQPWHV